MINPSPEQLAIIRSLKNCNCVIDSVAGCGKTTTIILIAMTYILDNILVLMYNKHQKENTKKTLRHYGLKNIDIHTYHSSAYRLYGSDCARNDGIQKLIDEDRNMISYAHYDMIIIDEAQDFTDLYYKYTNKLIEDIKKSATGSLPKLIILGDFMQEVNTFNGSNIEYILSPEKYFGGEWQHMSLTKTFRLTKPMVELVNAVNEYFIEGTRLLASDKESELRPKYYVCGTEFVFETIIEYLEVRSPHEIFIISPSVSKSPHITKLSNMLTNAKIPIYISGESSVSNDEAMNGKLVISTIHAIKGAERPVVFLVGFDDSILPKMLNKNPKNRSAILYVALTRAQEELLIFHNSSAAFIVPPNIIHQTCDFSIKDMGFAKNYLTKKVISPKENFCVTDLVKYLSHELIQECKKYIIVNRESIPEDNIASMYGIPNTVPSIVNGSLEEVSDINGFLVPAYHSHFCFNFESLLEYFNQQYSRTPYSRLIQSYIRELTAISDDVFMDIRDCEVSKLTRAATIYNGLCNKLFYKIEQISDFNWMNGDFLEECSSRIAKHVSSKANYEVPISRGPISGIIDAVDGDTVFEFKCTSMIEDEHLLQLALYSFLLPDKKYKLFNIYTNELLSITTTDSAKIAELLLSRN